MITICTATYNRKNLLKRLYASLKNQSCFLFEWIIIDDGSTDGTEEMVKTWDEKQFSITYKRQENRGKHCAINVGVSLANYDWFFIVDSDDLLVEKAVETIEKWIHTDLPDNCAAVSGVAVDFEYKLIGEAKIKGEYVDCKNANRHKMGLLGDKSEVYRTQLLRKFPFPEYEGEKFISECCVWDRISLEGYFVRWYKEPLRMCEYLEDGLSASLSSGEIELKNFSGFTYTTKIRLAATEGIKRNRIICQYIEKAQRKGLTLHEVSRILEVKYPSTVFHCIVTKIIRLFA